MVLWFQHRLSDETGAPVADGTHDVAFRLFDTSENGTSLWSETLQVETEQGNFAVELGTQSSLAVDFFSDHDQLWLELTMGADEPLPRLPLDSMPYAFVSARAELADDVNCTACIGAQEVDAAQVQRRVIGTCSSGAALVGINQDGTVQCQAVAPTWEPAQSCYPGQIPKWSGTDWECAQDTAMIIGAGPISGSQITDATIGAADVNADQVQLRVTGTCPTGSAIAAIDSTGHVSCHTDSDTTYLAGEGMTIVDNVLSTTLGTSIETNEITDGQVSFADWASNGCAANQIPRWNGSAWACSDDMTGASASLVQIPQANTLTTIDDTLVSQTAMTVGADGLPIIAYYQGTVYNSTKLRVAKCNDLACTSATISVVDSFGNVGQFPSIAMGTDKLAIISYFDVTNKKLKVAHCTNASCSAASTATLLGNYGIGTYGLYSAIVVPSNGIPVIGFYDVTGEDFEITHCTDSLCGTAAAEIVVDTAGNVGRNVNGTVGIDGNPIFAYYDLTNQDLKVVHCKGPNCLARDPAVLIDGAGGIKAGKDTISITIGGDGLPLIAYTVQPTYGKHLQVAKCVDVRCSSATVSLIDNDQAGQYNSITVGGDGLPILAYYGASSLRYAKCGTPACTAVTTQQVDPNAIAGTMGFNVSMSLGSDQLPVLAFTKGSYYPDLVVQKCANPFCSNNWSRR